MSLKWLVLPAAIILGLVAETGWPRGVDPLVVGEDLAIGWLFVGSGFLVRHSRPTNRIGLLLMATGSAWFAATYFPIAAFVYCGPLVHLLIAHPTGRLGQRRSRAVVVAAYAIAAVAALIPFASAGLVVGLLIVAIGAVRLAEIRQGSERLGAATDVLAIVVGLILAGTTLARMIGGPIDDVGLIAYQLALAAMVVSVVVDVALRTPSAGVLARFVVDLGDASDSGTLRDRLAEAVGDPSLVIGYAMDGEPDVWIDDRGRPLARPAEGVDRSVTPIVVGGAQLGFVAHDPAIVGDPRVFALIAAAAGLAISNSATQAEIRRNVMMVDASRERLVHAADAQGRRVEAALNDGVDQRLGRVAELLTRATIEDPADAQLASILDDLAAARGHLRDFSRGVYPAALTSGGLARAIDDLARRSPLPVDVGTVGTARYDPAVESTLYFVCSEALANVAKHARASRVRIDLDEDVEALVLRVADDGIGGASLGEGSGLRGLADRLEALGGWLLVDDRLGGGTSVTAGLPETRVARRPAAALA